MNDENLEQAFSEYLDSTQYELFEESYFQAIRRAYIAGWCAAVNQEDQNEINPVFPDSSRL